MAINACGTETNPVSDLRHPARLLWPAAATLWRREIVRFVRQRSRIIGALGTPLLFWLLIGSGLRNSFQAPGGAGTDYFAFLFPGTVAMILLFTAIFSTISVIEDRREGFLQSVLVAPAPRSAIVLGKVLGGTSLAVMQAAVFLLLAPAAGVHVTPLRILAAVGAMTLIAFALTCLGLWIAWRMESTQGFHAIMNLVLMPMWLLSGSFFPPGTTTGWLRPVVMLNPLTYGVTLLRHAISPEAAHNEAGAGLALLITALFAVTMFVLAVRLVTRETRHALQ